jgi:hypothetical protein
VIQHRPLRKRWNIFNNLGMENLFLIFAAAEDYLKKHMVD